MELGNLGYKEGFVSAKKAQNAGIKYYTKVGVFLVGHKSPIFEMDLGRLAPVSGGHTTPF
jgi:hypothetical protein